MASLPPNVRLSLTGTPENVVLVREMLSSVATAIGLDASVLNDIRTAVTEACNNVVLHAYEGVHGPLEIDVCITRDALNVRVCDRGRGIRAQPDADAVDAGLGLHLIQTLTHRVELESAPDGGTEVRMEFVTRGAARVEAPLEDGLGLPTSVFAGASPATVLSIAPISLARTVLPRIVSALAARAHFSIDRISDVQLLADTLVAYAHGATSGDRLSVGMNVEPRDLELHIAPLGVGRARRLIGDSQLGGLGRVIEKLTDRHCVARAGSYEMLTLGLIDRRRP